jgi:homoserine kinase
MKETYQNIGIDFDIHISKVNSQGVKKITWTPWNFTV